MFFFFFFVSDVAVPSCCCGPLQASSSWLGKEWMGVLISPASPAEQHWHLQRVVKRAQITPQHSVLNFNGEMNNVTHYDKVVMKPLL